MPQLEENTVNYFHEESTLLQFIICTVKCYHVTIRNKTMLAMLQFTRSLSESR